MRLVTDANIPEYIARQLNSEHFGGSNLSDRCIYDYAKKKKAVLVTSNYRDFENTGNFPLKGHPGSIVLQIKDPTRFKHYLDVVFTHFGSRKELREKRVLVRPTSMQIKHRNGRTTTVKIAGKNRRQKKH